jgi:hypothetical protein
MLKRGGAKRLCPSLVGPMAGRVELECIPTEAASLRWVGVVRAALEATMSRGEPTPPAASVDGEHPPSVEGVSLTSTAEPVSVTMPADLGDVSKAESTGSALQGAALGSDADASIPPPTSSAAPDQSLVPATAPPEEDSFRKKMVERAQAAAAARRR